MTGSRSSTSHTHAPILITGASGYVGLAAAAAAMTGGYAELFGTCLRHAPRVTGIRWLRLDLRDAPAVAALVASVRPAAIIHAAAAWDSPATACAVIVAGTRAVVAAAAAAGARLIHLSTDMVFDGEHAPYREADPPQPISYYGRAKAQAEIIVASGLEDYVVVRTSLVTCFDPPDPRTAQTLAGAITLFTDEYRAPIRTADLAGALVELIHHPYRGTLHVAGPERLSRYELGARAAAYHGLDASRLRSGTIAASGLIRPRDCTLDIGLAQTILRTPLRALPARRQMT